MAITITIAELETALGVDTPTATRLLAVSTELVNRFAPECSRRPYQTRRLSGFPGWLFSQPSASIRSESQGDISTGLRCITNLSPLRHSGAMALLSSWKVRRARMMSISNDDFQTP